MEIKILRKELDFSRTEAYFLDHINGGGVLGKTLLESLNFKEGRFFVFLPENAAMERLYAFSEGAINPISFDEKPSYIREVKGSTIEMRLTTTYEVSEFIKECMTRDGDCFAICEDVIQSRQDPHLAIPKVTTHFYENVVYYTLSKENSVEEICKTLRRTDYNWYSLMVLTFGRKPLEEVTLKDFESICENASYILTGAHDGENYIVWERNLS